MEEKSGILNWAIELQSIAQIGLTYAKDVFDIERPERPDKYMSWTQSEQGAWSTILGTGEDAIVTTRTRNELEPSVNGSYDVWQLITETSKGGVVASV